VLLPACSLLVVCALCAPPGAPVSNRADQRPAPDAESTPAERALAFLAREVPRWQPANRCFSCHNNGDAARALFRLRQQRYAVPNDAIADTIAWLTRPARWKDNHGDERFSDKTLANIQFAAALAVAQETGVVDDPAALRRAGELLVRDQQPDGAWQIGAEGAVGSPITYGRFLAAALCRDVFVRAGRRQFERSLEQVDHFLRESPPRTVVDAAGCLLGLGSAADPAAERQRGRCLEIIRAAEAREGGWGPYRNAPLEPFDTAVVVLALRAVPPSAQPDDTAAMLERARAYLVRTQLSDGTWPETTRPPDRDSYAHRVSTTAWATLALLAPGHQRH
jgi:Squalene-hopene cyclase C-terminal domain